MYHEPKTRLRVAAIDFLNPAPLLYNFEHEPAATELRTRYELNYTSPAQCANQLHKGDADLGLVPIGAMPHIPGLAAVQGCVIAALRQVRSIQLVLRPGLDLADVRTVAADEASRSSAAYAKILFRAFYGKDPVFLRTPPHLKSMLSACDAALLIGDPALLALESRDLHGSFVECTWNDLAALWHKHTGLPWVAAVWAVRQEALHISAMTSQQLREDLIASRDAGLAHTQEIVTEWSPRLALPRATIQTYLTDNIHYRLDPPCLQAIERFYDLAASTGVLPPYRLQML